MSELCTGRYVNTEVEDAWHMKGDLVSQDARSQYELTEALLGGALTRHDLSIQQVRFLRPSGFYLAC